MGKFKAVLFDLDGTLLNTIDDLADATNYMLRQYGYPQHEVEPYKYMVGNGMRLLVERALPENHRTDDEIEQGLKIFMPYYMEHSLDKTRPYDGIDELLDGLKSKGILSAVITNKAQTAAEEVVDKLLPNRFDIVCGQIDGRPTKPDPASANYAMQKLKVTADECIFIGDTRVDMQTAANCGAYAVGALWGFRERQELIDSGAKMLISSPTELLNIL